MPFFLNFDTTVEKFKRRKKDRGGIPGEKWGDWLGPVKMGWAGCTEPQGRELQILEEVNGQDLEMNKY